eukprot:7456516-Pyramimonas_sp.AAC.1
MVCDGAECFPWLSPVSDIPTAVVLSTQVQCAPLLGMRVGAVPHVRDAEEHIPTVWIDERLEEELDGM